MSKKKEDKPIRAWEITITYIVTKTYRTTANARTQAINKIKRGGVSELYSTEKYDPTKPPKTKLIYDSGKPK